MSDDTVDTVDPMDLSIMGWSGDLFIDRALAVILVAREMDVNQHPDAQALLRKVADSLAYTIDPPRGELVEIKGVPKSDD